MDNREFRGARAARSRAAMTPVTRCPPMLQASAAAGAQSTARTSRRTRTVTMDAVRDGGP